MRPTNEVERTADGATSTLSGAENPADARETRPTPRYVPMTKAHRRAAERFRATHVDVPPTDADRRIRPDYDI